MTPQKAGQRHACIVWGHLGVRDAAVQLIFLRETSLTSSFFPSNSRERGMFSNGGILG